MLDFILLCSCKFLKMSFRYLKNLLHKQHNSKTKLKRLTYLVQFVFKNISLRYRSNKSWRCHRLVDFVCILKMLFYARRFIYKIKTSWIYLVYVIYNKMSFRHLNGTSSRCFLIVIFLKISFRHLKQIFSRQNSF